MNLALGLVTAVAAIIMDRRMLRTARQRRLHGQ
jgi:hypothetical protein